MIVFQGSYTCGACKKGYLGDGYNGCYDDNYCESDRHTCSDVATCYYTGPATYRCEVKNSFIYSIQVYFESIMVQY